MSAIQMPRGLRTGVLALAVAAVVLGACGDDGDDSDDAADRPAATSGEVASDPSVGGATDAVDEVTTEAPGEVTTGGDGGVAGDDGGDMFECAITAEQVSEVFGVDLEKDEATCSFNVGGAVGGIPSAVFIGQLPELCTEEFATQLGYAERVEGLGVDAFLRTDGAATAQVLVCSQAPFDVVVDTGTDTGTGVAAAETLALIAMTESEGG